MNYTRKLLLLSIVISTAISINSCKSIVKISNINLSSVYKPEQAEIKPEVIIFHQNDNESTLYFRINSDELHYVKRSDDKNFKAALSVKYMILPSFNSTRIVDSASVVILDSLHFESGKYIKDSINFKAPQGYDYILHLSLYDHNRKVEQNTVYRIVKSGYYSIQNFKIYNESGEMLYSPKLSNASEIVLMHRNKSNFILNALHFENNFKPARPPFAETRNEDEELVANKSYTIDFKNGVSTLNIKDTGHYHFFLENDTIGGFSINYFHDGFPKITNHKEMLYPIRYLVSNTEYNAVAESNDLRSAIDRFWVNIAGDPVRAKSLVSRYYNNVQLSNTYFSSYKEGWKTDRGMIYTIFGAPDIVLFNDNIETWHYKDTWRIAELQFEFIKVPHKFFENNYILLRKGEYRNSWYLGIDNWRK
jgi:GWxTD domain-containing protein